MGTSRVCSRCGSPKRDGVCTQPSLCSPMSAARAKRQPPRPRSREDMRELSQLVSAALQRVDARYAADCAAQRARTLRGHQLPKRPKP